MKLLMHSCCAPCLTSCLIGFDEVNFHENNPKPDLFWYNPNIHPFTEYRSRRDSLKALAQAEQLELFSEDEYGLRMFIKGTENISEEGGRCSFCYSLRLEKTARVAAEKGYNAFSTSLLTSPYQRHDIIKQIGDKYAQQYGVDFFYLDFRTWFRKGQNKAREAGTYMQKYCGCIFSEEERYLGK